MANQIPLTDQVLQQGSIIQHLLPRPGLSQEILLTTLANGIEGGRLRLSVCVSPRLRPEGPGSLSAFPNFLDWPKLVSTLTFKVFIGPTPDQAIPYDAEPMWSAATVDSPLWNALFPATTPVRPYPLDQDACRTNYDIKPVMVEKQLFHNVLKRKMYQAVAVGEVLGQRIKADGFAQLPAAAMVRQLLETAGVLVKEPTLNNRLNVGYKNPMAKMNAIKQQLQRTPSPAPGTSGIPQVTRPGIFLRRSGPIQSTGPIQSRGVDTVVVIPRLVPSDLLQTTDTTQEQLQFLEFQVSKQLLATPSDPLERLRIQPMDFHQLVGSLADYPEIMRRLGLVLDFRINAEPAKLPLSSFVWVRPVVAPATARQYLSPRSEYVLNSAAGWFRLKPMNDLMKDGCLTLGKTTGTSLFDVVPGDVEGATEKLEKYAQLILDASLSPDQPHDGALPALRSAGLAVAQSNRDVWLGSLVEGHNQLHCRLAEELTTPNFPDDHRGTTAHLNFEHVARGLRIDVRELSGNAPPGPWRSLSVRKGHYLVGPAQQPVPNVPEDEGWVALGSMKPVASTLIIYESLFRWAGWSLAVPRPGREFGMDGTVPPGPGTSMNMTVKFDPVAGTLPKLRFGRQYQFRARVVDLAGNSLLLTENQNPPNELLTSAQDGYYDRLEPVGSPIVLLKYPLLGPPTSACPQGQPLSPGESVARLVIRTANVEGQGPPAAPVNTMSGRHLVPPRVSQDMAEAHGMFDDAASGRLRPDAYPLMLSKDGTLSTTQGASPGFGPDGKPVFEDVHPEESITVPYLPDPLALGATFFNLPGTGASQYLQQYPFGGTWPHRTSFQLRVEAGTGAPVFSGGLLRLFLPPGEQLTVQMSSHFAPGQETLMGIWRWIVEEAHNNPQVNLSQFQALVGAGRHWMLTPFREIVLVHATQQPVHTPQWVSLVVGPQRTFGQTGASLTGMIDIHRPSTQKLDLAAVWIDPIDEGPWPPTPPPDPTGNPYSFLFVTKNAHAFDTQVPLDPMQMGCDPQSTGPSSAGIQFRPGITLEQALGAQRTRTRGVDGEPEAESTAPEGSQTDLPEGHTPASEPSAGDVPEQGVQERGVPGGILQQRAFILPRTQAQTTQPAQTPLQKALTPGDFLKSPLQVGPFIGVHLPPPYDESKHRCAPPFPNPPQRTPMTFDFCGVHQFGDTKYRCVEYSAVAASRYREYFYPLPDFPNCPQPTPSEPRFVRVSAPVKVDILSSAPPAAPNPLYIIPTFRWEETAQGRRRIGGIRIYLDRPWFSSGMGEQLAVVLYGHDYPEIEEQAKPYVSQWGLDPLWVGGEPLSMRSGSISDLTKNFTAFQPSVTPRGVEPEEPVERGVSKMGQAQLFKEGVIEAVNPHLAALAALSKETVGVTYPQPIHFHNPAAVREDLHLEQVVGRRPITITTPNGGKASQMPMQATPLPVKICAFNVLPDHARQLWYCDIEMDPGIAYFPFVRLALARYQVNAIPGAHLSPIVLADFAQLVPDRIASVAVNPSNPTKAMVSVTGVIGQAPPARTPLVEVTVEQFNPTLPGALGWSPVPNVPPIILSAINEGQRAGEITLPPPGGPEQYRLVIKEYEVFAISEEGAPFRREERRLVYADVLGVPR